MSDAEAQMRRLRERFLARAESDRATMISALAVGDRAGLLKLAHGLAGVAGIFGYGDISSRASALEDAVDAGAGEEMVSVLAQALIDALGRV